MDSARDKRTGKIVCAIDLWLLDKVDEYGYECVSCGLTLEPASYKKEINLKRPYFRRYKGTTHDKNCGVKQANKLKLEARKRSISTSEGFPLPYVSKLVLEDTYHNGVGPFSKGGIRSKTPLHRNGNTKHHDHTTDTIRPIAKTYVDYPLDRDYLSLDAPDVEGSTYEEVFQYLYHVEDVYYPKPKIFYGSLHYKKTDIHDDFADVSLSQGMWEVSEGKNTLTHPYVVRIQMEGWTEKLKSCVLDEIDLTRKEIKEAHREGNKKVKGWLFFLGTQDPSNRFLFNVSDYRLICCFADTMPRLSLNRKGSSVLDVRGSLRTTSIAPIVEQQIVTTPKVGSPQNSINLHRVETPAIVKAPIVLGTDRRETLVSEKKSQRPLTSVPLAHATNRDVRKAVSHEATKVSTPKSETRRSSTTVSVQRNPSPKLETYTTGFRRIRHWLRRLIDAW